MCKKIKSQFHVSCWFQGFQNLIIIIIIINIIIFIIFENLLQSKFSNYFQPEIIYWSSTFLDFLTAFYIV